jgi:2-oxoglutarate dehydrogenase E1 component
MQSTDLSYLSSSDNSFIDSLYQDYKKDPNSVDESWKKFFEGFEFALKSSGVSTGEMSRTDLDKEFRAFRIIQSFRARGHLLSKTNPIRERKNRHPHLDLADYGLSQEDLNRPFICGEYLGLGIVSLKEIITHLENIYCRSLGFEYMHITDTDIRRWFRDKIESTAKSFDFPLEKKKRILSKLNEAVVFENFLHTKYVGQKRFSLEGGENTITALDAIVNRGAELGVEEFVFGMAHRGRLNVLANIMRKTYEYIFSEFEGTYPDGTMGDGDVKYHLGYTSRVETPDKKNVWLKMMPNPSHLEAVDPVVSGFTRAQCDNMYKGDKKKVCPILIHGDAAVAGQGIVYELVQMSKLPGYDVGGTIHFVTNNQIGFTTDFDDARSSIYCTSVARILNSPVIHVNGDDAEAVVYAVELATEFRQTFGMDVFVDMVCYRKHGHNEGDEPKYTQPTFYDLISKHPNPREIYTEKLIEGNKIESQLAFQMQEQFKQSLQDRLNLVKEKALPVKLQDPEAEWKNLRRSTPDDFDASPDTKTSKANIETVLKALTTIPSDFKPIKKAEKIVNDRLEFYNADKLDWALGELLAYGTLLLDGVNIRVSGQDCIRGTFSHRHARIFDEKTNKAHDFLNNIKSGQAQFRIYNSLLSEYAVLGFEYGYSLAHPNSINIWEAQFGDFANGAQTIIDQFISSAESKWQRQSGLYMYLPHGYEGQGPEHSNARPERFLQLAAEYNMVVANLTTPANLFHILRRQIAWPFRKPVIIMTPKSLLRHPLCVSSVKDLTHGKFQEIIDDESVKVKDVKRVILCSGKIYYELLEKRTELKRNDVALVRLEQMYPMPEKQIQALWEKYSKAERVWVQEEPRNMGAATFLSRYDIFDGVKTIARKSSASPATGYSTQHKREQKEILDKSFNI